MKIFLKKFRKMKYCMTSLFDSVEYDLFYEGLFNNYYKTKTANRKFFETV